MIISTLKKGDRQYCKYVLFSDWCEGGSKVEWYSSSGNIITTLKPPAKFVIGKEADQFYEYRCYLEKGVCIGGLEFKDFAKSPGDDECNPPSTGQVSGAGGRVAATEAAAAVICPPDDKVDLGVAMKIYLSTLLCQSVYLYQGDPAKAAEFLANLKAAILNNPQFAALNITFPTDDAAILAALVAGDCEGAAGLLSQTITGQIPFETFNAIKNGTYKNIQDGIITQNLDEIDISQVDVPILQAIPMSPTETARLAAAQNCENISVRYKSTTPSYLVNTKLPEGASCFYDATKHHLIIWGLTGSNSIYNGSYIPVFGTQTGKFKGFYKLSAYLNQPDCQKPVNKFKDTAKPKPACEEHFLPRMWWDIDRSGRRFYEFMGTADGEPSLQKTDIVAKLDDLIEEMLSDGSFESFLKSGLIKIKEKNGKIEIQDLENLYRVMLNYREAQIALFGKSEPSLFDKLYELFKLCQDYKGPLNTDCVVDPDILPRCIWDGIAPKTYDRAFVAGLIDGAAGAFKGVYGVFQILGQIVQWADCWVNPFEFSDRTSTPDCQLKRDKTIQNLKLIKELYEYEGLLDAIRIIGNQVGESLGAEFDVWLDQISCDKTSGRNIDDPCCWYQRGKAAFDIASLFFGVGELKGGMKIVDVTARITSKINAFKIAAKSFIGASKATIVGLGKIIKKSATALADEVELTFVRTGMAIRGLQLQAIAGSSSGYIKWIGTTTREPLADALKVAFRKVPKEATQEVSEEFRRFKVGDLFDDPDGAAIMKQIQDANGDKYISFGKNFNKDGRSVYRITAILAATGTATRLIVPEPMVDIENQPDDECEACDKAYWPCLVYQKATYPAKLGALNKLCTNNPTRKDAICQQLYAYDVEVIDAFLGDLMSNLTNPDALSNHVNNIDVALVRAWKVVYEAKNAVSTNYQKDFSLLAEAKNNKSVTSFMNNIGQDAGFVASIAANKGLRCKTCTNKNSYVQFGDEYMKDLIYFSGNYNDSKLWTDLKQPRAYKTVLGAAFQLRVLRSQTFMFRTGTVSFDQTLDDTDADNAGDDDTDTEETRSKCRYDIKVTIGITNNFYEFKSWSKSYVNTFKNDASKRTYFANQLKQYLRNATSLDNINYIFDGRRITETQAKEILQTVFRDKAEEWWNDNGTAAISQQKLKSLFDVLTLEDLKLKIEDISNPIFYFIKTF